MGTWNNNDGLRIKLGVDEGFSTHNAGHYKQFGPVQTLEFEIDLTELTESETVVNDVTVLPKGSQIEEVQVVTEVAAATGTAIDLGLVRLDRTTEIDFNGVLAAFPTSAMNAVGEKTTGVNGSSNFGALVGANSSATYPALITCSRTDSTAFTAGRIVVRIVYRPNAFLVN